MNITQFDKTNLDEIRAALNAALGQVEANYGVKFDVGNISYRADSFKCGIQAVIAQSVSDPYLAGVSATFISEIKRYSFGKKLLSKVKTSPTSPTYVIVGMKGKGHLIAKLDGQPTGQMYRLEFRNGNYLYCQVLDKPYNEDFDKSFNKFKA